MQTPRDPEAREQFRSIALVSQLGFASGMPVIICGLGGYWLEQQYSAKGLWVIGGVLVGVAGGLVAAFRILAPFLKMDNDDDES